MVAQHSEYNEKNHRIVYFKMVSFYYVNYISIKNFK